MVAAGVGSAAKVSDVALEMACGPVSDSISTELMKSTLQAGRNGTKEESRGLEYAVGNPSGATGTGMWQAIPQCHWAEVGG